MKKLSIYYLIHIIINIILIVCFRSYMNIHLLSILPIFLSCLMAFQVTLFKVENHRSTTGDTAFSVRNTVRLTDKEMNCQFSYLRHSFLVCIPFEIPLIFFLSSYWKLLSIVPYVFAFILGGIVCKMKMGKQIKLRIDEEKKELEEQIKREEIGLK